MIADKTFCLSHFKSKLWDDELEMMSLRNGLKCEMEHDTCRRTAKYKIAGQNLALFGSKPNFKPIEDAIKGAVEGWYNEYKDVPNIREVERMGSSGADFSKIGHWVQLVQAKAHRIGCSIVKYTDEDNWKQVLIGCNYNAGNLVDQKIFQFGEPASLCKSGKNRKYPGLCSAKEDYSKHENGDWYFDNNAAESPVVKAWLQNGKKLDR